MKHIIYSIICLLTSVLVLVGCQKEAINPDIEGQWQLLEFTTKADNQVHKCERIYYSIQLWVVEVREKQGLLGLESFRGRYKYDEESNTIAMTDMSTYPLPSVPAEVWQLEPYGLNRISNEAACSKKDEYILEIKFNKKEDTTKWHFLLMKE